MEDWPLPRLTPGDPRNLLSHEARCRVDRAYFKGIALRREADVQIDNSSVSDRKATAIRKQADLKAARHVLGTVAKEFGKLSLPFAAFQKIMRGEVDDAANSLELSTQEELLLRAEFLLPPSQEVPAAAANGIAKQRLCESAPAQQEPPVESIASQLRRLREESRLTIEEIAEGVGIEPRSVFRHFSGEAEPRKRHLTAYGRVFSNVLKKQVVIRKTS